jgi:protein-S-isoprenylcysteine O-methyltransferase Ste14
MSEAKDNANVVIPPPIAWAVAFLVGLGLNWLYPLPVVSAGFPRGWVGGAVVAIGVVLAITAIATFHQSGTHIPPYKPTTTIVAHGPYALTRNPIYIGMFLGQIGLSIAFNSWWILAMLVPFVLVIRYGVIAREEAYLERKFGDTYLDYKSRVRRWV